MIEKRIWGFASDPRFLDRFKEDKALFEKRVEKDAGAVGASALRSGRRELLKEILDRTRAPKGSAGGLVLHSSVADAHLPRESIEYGIGYANGLVRISGRERPLAALFAARLHNSLVNVHGNKRRLAAFEREVRKAKRLNAAGLYEIAQKNRMRAIEPFFKKFSARLIGGEKWARSFFCGFGDVPGAAWLADDLAKKVREIPSRRWPRK